MKLPTAMRGRDSGVPRAAARRDRHAAPAVGRRPVGRGLVLPTACAFVLLLAGCATRTPDPSSPAPAAARWQAPLPHGGDVGAMTGWWSRFDDPLLPALVADAQSSSPTLAQALARVRQGRAGLRVAEGRGWPGLAGSLQASRASDSSTSFAAVSQASATLQAQWEIDLFGGVRHGIDAARARAGQAEAGWHEARVSLAADVARSYFALRACEALAEVFAQSETSQRRSAELTREKLRVGFESPANAALADAAAAQARDRLVAQQADCDVELKSLVALTGLEEPALRERLAPARARIPASPAFGLDPMPAAVLAQRPDLAAAARELVAAASDVGAADAARYPQLTLNGAIGGGVLRLGGATQDAVTWSLGPSLFVPLFDGGQRSAQRDAAQGRYEESRAGFESRLRGAVREVEESLVRLDASGRRLADAQAAANGFREYFGAAEARWRVGAGSLIEMEEARRLALNAQASLLGVQLERELAWVALYRAAGGGWRAGEGLPGDAAMAPAPGPRAAAARAAPTVDALAATASLDAGPRRGADPTERTDRRPRWP